MADTSASTKRLTTEEKDRLDALGVDVKPDEIVFNRQLDELEMKQVLRVLVDLGLRTPDPQTHVGPAVEQWLERAQQWFGKQLPLQWLQRHRFLTDSRNYLLQFTGATLIQLQTLELTIRACTTVLGLERHGLSPEDLLSNDPTTRKRTLGQLVRALEGTHMFEEGFEERLTTFVKDRNLFVHSFWTELFHSAQDGDLPSDATLRSVHSFLARVFNEATSLQQVFHGLYFAVGKAIAANEGKLEQLYADFADWAQYEEPFLRTLRHPPDFAPPGTSAPPADQGDAA